MVSEGHLKTQENTLEKFFILKKEHERQGQESCYY